MQRRAFLFFATGLLLGLALPHDLREPWSAPDARGALVAEPQLVRGSDEPGASDPAVPEPVAPKPVLPPPGEPSAALVAAKGLRRKASEIARDGLTFTAFVQGRSVYGAGILLDARGHVLTCRHVIEGLPRITVAFADGAEYPASVLEVDPQLDLALLQIDAGRTPALRTASIASVELGDDLFAMGAPRKMKFSLSRGMASFVGRPFGGLHYLQSDFALNDGSSGGPVMNDRGEVVAMSSFVLRNSEGLAFALPIDYALRRFATRLAGAPALGGADGNAFEGWLARLGLPSVRD
jgi:S1-C subfamily serine protease